MNLKKFLFGKKLKKEETLAYILRKTGRIKILEKKYESLREMVRKAETDRNKLAMRITKLKRKMEGKKR